MKLVVELPFDMVPIGVDGELEAAEANAICDYPYQLPALLGSMISFARTPSKNCSPKERMGKGGTEIK